MANNPIGMREVRELLRLYFQQGLSGRKAAKIVGRKMHKQWNSKLYLWQGVIFSSTGLTFLFMFILKWTNILSF